MGFLIKLATRSRPSKFYKVMQNIKHMTTAPYQVIITADLDDRTMNNPQIKKYVASLKWAQIFYGPHVSKIEAINRDIDKAQPWDILVNMSDDFQIIRRGWNDIVKHRCAEKWPGTTDFFAHFSDYYVHDALPTISIMGREYYQRDGYIYHPSYRSFSSDSEAYYVARARGKHCYFEDSLFKHEHPANNKRLKNDVLYKINAIHSKDDVKTYFERLNRDFDLTIPGPFPWDEYKTV
jgi:hypothetical protein